MTYLHFILPSVPDQWRFDTDPDPRIHSWLYNGSPEPAFFFSGLRDVNKINKSFFFSSSLLFGCIYTSPQRKKSRIFFISLLVDWRIRIRTCTNNLTDPNLGGPKTYRSYLFIWTVPLVSSESSDTPGWWRGWPSTPWPTQPLFTFFRRCWALPRLSATVLRLLVLSSPWSSSSFCAWRVMWRRYVIYFMYYYMWCKLFYSLHLVKFPIRTIEEMVFYILLVANVECGSLNKSSH